MTEAHIISLWAAYVAGTVVGAVTAEQSDIEWPFALFVGLPTFALSVYVFYRGIVTALGAP